MFSNNDNAFFEAELFFTAIQLAKWLIKQHLFLLLKSIALACRGYYIKHLMMRLLDNFFIQCLFLYCFARLIFCSVSILANAFPSCCPTEFGERNEASEVNHLIFFSVAHRFIIRSWITFHCSPNLDEHFRNSFHRGEWGWQVYPLSKTR